ncbi:DUF6538 domain-containing protein [Octadecabacter arcticus]|uniref:DUF6538 domain-containing protein n=1 Tax=Octadecabacter arcticus TaxID=53946 RepID=UPI0026C3115C
MPRYLLKQRQGWYAVLEVPKALKGKLGKTRFKQTLSTQSLTIAQERVLELLSNLVFEYCWSCGDLVGVCGFDSVFERDACDDFCEVVKAA